MPGVIFTLIVLLIIVDLALWCAIAILLPIWLVASGFDPIESKQKSR